MSGIKSLAQDNILTKLNIETSVHMYNIGRNVRSVICVEIAKNSILLHNKTVGKFLQ